MGDRTGQTIGEYMLHGSLGTDRYGTRYRATATGDSVTVRIIRPPTSDDRWFADRIASTLRRHIGAANPTSRRSRRSAKPLARSTPSDRRCSGHHYVPG